MTKNFFVVHRNLSKFTKFLPKFSHCMLIFLNTHNLDSNLCKKGYVISFVNVENYSQEKETKKWKHNYVMANDQVNSYEAIVRKLRTDTLYYFKIQARNKRAYGGSSPTIIYRTPDSNLVFIKLVDLLSLISVYHKIRPHSLNLNLISNLSF